MQTMDDLTTNTAEMLGTTSPMDFFSMVQHIESRICAKTVDMLSARRWDGPLTQQDWQIAEALVLDPVQVSCTLRSDGLLYRVPVKGYRPEEIRLHLEGELLCLCGCLTRPHLPARMFYTRMKLPGLARDYRVAAWISGEILHIAFTREQAPAAQMLPGRPRAAQSIELQYAAAV
ncbi:hypothetical protein Terro_2556 [Terriglobus roseus DSM 18391]|uniref:SHSP domain-containing protein n=1 Tax=Terriglobus roseus (strain DSM 18391 / NRRL B-41598 / KBS 63) TaxID=926566 RepID=I3ZHT2_TERRK|nr:hypothetical protein [Terriglobus roseus]AFL88458.1 hypothetical protein Terro_2192 [Terriglobus roseus DSM 18391]AFL88800.1 hypothetical protein Terro_2556 [Terriglobus roseus DSM 18391]